MNTRIANRRNGLTLMELVVVMVILVALAGVMLPMFSGMSTKAHTSSAATNLTELSKAVQMYGAGNKLPYNLDNIAPLVGQTNPVTGLPILAVTAGTGTTFTSSSADISVAQLQSADAAMLTAGGMTTALTTTVPTSSATVGAWTPTYNPYSTTAVGATFLPQNSSTPSNGGIAGAATPLVTGTNVVYVSPYAVARELGMSTTSAATARFVLFGVGDYSSLSQTALQQAPIHFDDSASGGANVVYCRFGLVFQTTADGTGTDFPQAQFIGTVDLGDSTLTSVGDHVQGYLNTK